MGDTCMCGWFVQKQVCEVSLKIQREVFLSFQLKTDFLPRVGNIVVLQNASNFQGHTSLCITHAHLIDHVCVCDLLP